METKLKQRKETKPIPVDIVTSKEVHEALALRWGKLDVSSADIVKYVFSLGIDDVPGAGHFKDSLYEWRKDRMNSSITAEQVWFLCLLYGINVELSVGTLQWKENADKNIYYEWKIKQYNEEQCLNNVKKYFK